MAKRLTDISVRNLRKAASRREIPDGGQHGLYAIVQPSGRKGFAVRYRFNGAPRKLTLASGISLAVARKLAADAMHQLAQGIDPAVAKQDAKAKAVAAAADTVEAVCREYIRPEHAKLRTAGQRESILARLVYPVIGKRPIEDVRRSEIIRLLDRIEDDGGARTADVTLSIIRRVFHWHARRSDTFRSPIIPGMTRHSTTAHARSRVLSDDELRALWRATEAPTPYHALTRFLLLSAARRGEAVGLTWNELADGVWTLPPRRNKTGRELVRPLSSAALALVDAQPRIVGCNYVFSHGRGPLGGLSKAKAALDAASGVTGWRVHDVRRSSRTLLARAGVSVEVAEHCLGHVVGGVRGTYDRHQYQAEMLHAYEALARQIELIVAPVDKVVPLRARS